MPLVVKVRTLEDRAEALDGEFLLPKLVKAICILAGIHHCKIREEIRLRGFVCLSSNCGNTVGHRLNGEAIFMVVSNERFLERFLPPPFPLIPPDEALESRRGLA
jgi:hypothetical protein